MIDENVVIDLISEEILDGRSDKTKNTYTGKFFNKNGKFYLSYQDAFSSSEKAIKTILKFDEKEMYVTRHMPRKNQMYFSCGGSCKTNYQTPYGIYVMDIETVKYIAVFMEDKFEISIEYKIFLNGTDAGIRKLKFEIKSDV